MISDSENLFEIKGYSKIPYYLCYYNSSPPEREICATSTILSEQQMKVKDIIEDLFYGNYNKTIKLRNSLFCVEYKDIKKYFSNIKVGKTKGKIGNIITDGLNNNKTTSRDSKTMKNVHSRNLGFWGNLKIFDLLFINRRTRITIKKEEEKEEEEDDSSVEIKKDEIENKKKCSSSSSSRRPRRHFVPFYI